MGSNIGTQFRRPLFDHKISGILPWFLSFRDAVFVMLKRVEDRPRQ